MTLRAIHSSSDSPTEEEPTPPRVGQFVGSLLGCALGDAVGAWAERKPSEVAAQYATEVVRPYQFDEVGHHHGNSTFGQYTDDTQLTRELVLSILDEGAFAPEAFARRVASIFADDKVVGAGGATREAALRLNAGVPWEQAGTPLPRAGNGAAMRAAPIGLLHWNDMERLLKDAHDQAVITHQAEMAVAGSTAISVATAMCLNASLDTSGPHERGWWAWMARFVGRESPSFGTSIDEMASIIFEGRKKKWKAGEDAERDAVLNWVLKDDDDSWDGVSPWARTSVLWSLYCLAAHPKNIWEAIVLAIWPGGDVDTTAAMAGALVVAAGSWVWNAVGPIVKSQLAKPAP